MNGINMNLNKLYYPQNNMNKKYFYFSTNIYIQIKNNQCNQTSLDNNRKKVKILASDFYIDKPLPFLAKYIHIPYIW